MALQLLPKKRCKYTCLLFLFSFSGGDDSLDGIISLRGITVSKRTGIRTASSCSLRGYLHQNGDRRLSRAFCADAVPEAQNAVCEDVGEFCGPGGRRIKLVSQSLFCYSKDVPRVSSVRLSGNQSGAPVMAEPLGFCFQSIKQFNHIQVKLSVHALVYASPCNAPC